MVRQARLCVVESAQAAYGMDEQEFALMQSLEPLDICDCCGEPCEIRSETLISVCDECRAKAEEDDEDDATAYEFHGTPYYGYGL